VKKLAARLLRLPRAVYWIAGAAIACTGALGARFLSELLPLADRVPVWLAGGGLIFLGLCVLSLGTRGRLAADDDEPDPVLPVADAVEKPAAEVPAETGAGEGNRTLA
jgi:hypothetical protein